MRILIAALLLAGAAAAETYPSSAGPLRVDAVATGLDQPWGMAFLPDGRVLVTERGGALRLIDDGAVSAPIQGVPAVYDSGQGGLLDVAISPDFAETGLIFLSYAEPAEGGARTAVARATLAETRLEDVAVIFRQRPALSGGRHFGSRIVPAPDGTLFVTLGDRGARDSVQDPSNLIGKLVRIAPDGSIPADNPFVGREGYAPEIYSIGHRNTQGAGLDAEGRLWTVSHGAAGGDEINRPEPGRNYGWPVISYGSHYSGARIGEGTEKPGLEQPEYYWDPSIAPSGLTVYDGDLFPDWRGDIFVGALRAQLLARVDMEAGSPTGAEERLLDGALGRIRAVATGPDGALWLLTDESPGGLYRITPAE
jgi:glucose/arabinose dehydrogenase